MGQLTRDLILGCQDLRIETVPVPEWGDGATVNVRGMNGSERDSFEQSLFVGDGEERKFSADNVRAKLLVRCIVDEAGKRLFTNEDADALGMRNAAALDRIYDVAQRLSGIGSKDLKKALGN